MGGLTVTYAPRKCGTCRLMRPADEFISAGPRAQCEPCRQKTNEAARQVRPGGWSPARASHLRRRYGMQPEDYDALRVKQDYRCAICGTHEDDIPALRSGRPRLNGEPPTEPFRLLVDHCHDSGRVRGLLCHTCNVAIGCAKDSPEILRAAIRYIETR